MEKEILQNYLDNNPYWENLNYIVDDLTEDEIKAITGTMEYQFYVVGYHLRNAGNEFMKSIRNLTKTNKE